MNNFLAGMYQKTFNQCNLSRKNIIEFIYRWQNPTPFSPTGNANKRIYLLDRRRRGRGEGIESHSLTNKIQYDNFTLMQWLSNYNHLLCHVSPTSLCGEFLKLLNVHKVREVSHNIFSLRKKFKIILLHLNFISWRWTEICWTFFNYLQLTS